MLNFQVTLKAGAPIYEQTVIAVKRAIAQGRMKPGDPFPSVRELSRELRINPNTAQKIVTALVHERILEVRPGIGSVVSDLQSLGSERLESILGEKLETIIIEAVTLGVDENTFMDQVKRLWKELTKKGGA